MAGITGPSGSYLVSTDDAYVKADNTTIAPKVSGYLQQGAGEGQSARGDRPGAGADRRPRLQGRARSGQGGCGGGGGRDRQQARAARRAAGGDRCGEGDARCRHGGGDVRRAGKQALHRSRRDRLWQRPERAERAGARCQRAGHDRARQGESRLGAEAGRTAQGRDRAGQCRRLARANALQRQAELNLAYTTITRADRRRRRQPHAARRPISCRPERS